MAAPGSVSATAATTAQPRGLRQAWPCVLALGFLVGFGSGARGQERSGDLARLEALLAESDFSSPAGPRRATSQDPATSRGRAAGPARLVLFPEMDAALDVPEITMQCWEILGVAPETMMCATSRMIVKRQGAASPVVVPCTLLPYDPAFELGEGLARAAKTVQLNHPHCAKFCVLGGASCSPQ